MSQSKISSIKNEKKFELKYSFKNVMNMKNSDELNAPIEKHFNIPWQIQVRRVFGTFAIRLNCMLPPEKVDWSIQVNMVGKIIRKSDKVDCQECSLTYNKENPSLLYNSHNWTELPEFLFDGNYNYEFTVTILKANGIEIGYGKSRNFENESAREDSDATLIVQGRKFHVLKMYLATHSSYFKGLFSGSFSESEKSEIELKDIDPDHFQFYLEFLYAESFIEAHSALGVLHLADFFDSKTVIKRCQEFLMEKSKLSLAKKFEVAIKYNLEELKTKCISEMNTVPILNSIITSENAETFDTKLWKRLCLKSLSIPK